MPGNYVERFTGRGTEAELVCADCAANRATAFEASDEVVARVRDHARVRFDGQPQHVRLPSEVWFEHETIELDVPALVELRALGADDRARWLGVTDAGALLELDLDRRSVRELHRVAILPPVDLHVSNDGAFAAVVEADGVRGEIVELATGRRIPLARQPRHANQASVPFDMLLDDAQFPFAFVAHAGRQIAIYAPAWNRLAAFDVRTGEALTARPTPAPGDRHHLDYFHGELHVSPGGQMIADNGWVRRSFGTIATWSLARWLDDNAWESDDGRSLRQLADRTEPALSMCWLDDTRLAVLGHEGWDHAIDIYDTRTGTLERWFAGPEAGSELVFDRVLFGLGSELEVYDVERGGRLLGDPKRPRRYHRGAKCFAALPRDGRATISRLRGLDAHAPWATDEVRTLAASITDLELQLGVLGDALDDAGCDDAEMLAHCRAPGPHGRHCWVLDRLARR